MATATDTDSLYGLQPDPLEPRPEQVERYVKALQELAKSDPDLARREVWNQIRLAGARAGSNRGEVEDTLNRIFRLGTPPEPALDGPCRGILVTTTTHRASDPLLRALSSAWMPWVGKRFEPGTESGDNIFVPSVKVPAKVLWPSYELHELGDGRYWAFKFRTYTSPGTVDPDIETFKIDYDSEENPSLLIRDILDELVQIVPGANLGKVLLKTGKGPEPNWHLIGYFALEPGEPVEVTDAVAVDADPAPAPA